MPADRREIRYVLTDKGHALLPTMIALRQWSDLIWALPDDVASEADEAVAAE